MFDVTAITSSRLSWTGCVVKSVALFWHVQTANGTDKCKGFSSQLSCIELSVNSCAIWLYIGLYLRKIFCVLRKEKRCNYYDKIRMF
jgi:hypothetical protein